MLRGISPASVESSPVVTSFTQITYRGAVLPSLSPDGSWIAYASAGPGNFDIFVQDVESQVAFDVTSDSSVTDTEPSISPDGRQVAFRSARQGGGIFIMGRNGESPQRVTDFGYTPSWSPSGSDLAIASEPAVTSDTAPLASALWIVPAAGGDARRLETGEAFSPRWSPHGHRIAYWGRSDTGRRVIWTVLPGGDGARPVTSLAANTSFSDWSPAWSADGRAIYFVSDRNGTRNLWTIAVDERTGVPKGEPRSVAVPGELAAISISQNGTRLACAWTSGSSVVERLGIDPSNGAITDAPDLVAPSGAAPVSVAVSPDGDWLAYSSGPPPERLFISRSDGSGARQVTSGMSAALDPRWSPDGRALAFSEIAADEGQLKILNRDGQADEPLSDERGWRHPIWSPDGRQIAAVNRLGEIGLFDAAARRAPPRSRVALPDARRPVSRGTTPLLWDWSPDGSMLAGEDSSGPFVFNPQSTECVGLVGFSGTTAFMPDNRRLIVADSRGTVMLVDAATSAPANVISVAPDRLAGMSLSRDGRQLFILRVAEHKEIFLATIRAGSE